MDWLTKLFKPAMGEDTNVLWLYVQCDRCGTPLAVRINKRNEMVPDYENGGYELHKEMMDSKCFQLMHAEMHTDAQGKVDSKNVDHGRFLTRAEYETLKAQGK